MNARPIPYPNRGSRHRSADIVLLGAASRTIPLAEALEYCLELELVDTRTGVPVGVRHCEPDPGYAPVEVPLP